MAFWSSIHSFVDMDDATSLVPLEQYSQALYTAVLAAVPGWICRRVQDIVAQANHHDPKTVLQKLDELSNATHSFVAQHLQDLLAQDVDAQRQNPLHVIRQAHVFTTQHLEKCGVAYVRRDSFDESIMPNDVYAIGPLTWRDLSDDVHDAGITWGAWKAATILQRRRSEGQLP